MIQSALNETGEFNARPAFTGLRLSSITEWVLALDVMEQRRLASMFIEGVIKVNGGDFPRRLLWWLLRGGHISSARFPLYWFFFLPFFLLGVFSRAAVIYDDQHTDDVHLIFSLFSTSVFSLVSPFFWAGQLAGMQAPSSLFFFINFAASFPPCFDNYWHEKIHKCSQSPLL